MPIIDSSTGEVARTYTVEELIDAVREMRAWDMISLVAAGSGHTGGTMSIMDIAAALYLSHIRHDPSNPQWDGRDRVFWSAGHKAPALYCALGKAGYFDDLPVAFEGEPLEQFADIKGIQEVVLLRKLGSPFEGHPHWPKLPGLEFSSGSLGQGLGVACGSALDARLKGKDYRVYCIMGDGEQDEGSIWEGAMFAGHHKLDNLVGILDKNLLQIDGATRDVMDIDPIADKYRAFNWEVIEIDGHDMAQILDGLQRADAVKGKPALILAHTVKGKCIDYAEHVVGYHGIPPKGGRSGEESLDEAILCLQAADEFPHERVDKILAFAEAYQKVVDERVNAVMPRFSRDYWWNEAEDMQVEMDATRNGFGAAIAELGADERVIAHGADITGSIRMDYFYKPDGKNEDPERRKRFISCGIAEANMALVAAGFAKEGRIPFIGSYGVFVTGRNWDQLRTTVAYGGFPVKIADAHGGISVGPDGATHQALEEISVITPLPGFVMEVPCDSVETAKATKAIAYNDAPSVVRYAREATPVVTTENTPFEAGVANVIRFRGAADKFLDAFETVLAPDYESEGEDVAIIACGPMVPEAMRAAYILKQELDLETRIVNAHTVKPIDADAITAAAGDIGIVVTAEEHQVGGFGNIVAGVICKGCLDRPIKLDMVGVQDRFGASGAPWELVKTFGLTAEHIAEKALALRDK
jgi:transketolase